MYLLRLKHIYCSYACAINLGSTVVITGGYSTKTTVSEYSQEGWVRDLPSLQQGRYGHGCSYFVSDDGTKVDIDKVGFRQRFQLINYQLSIKSKSELSW